MPFVRQVKFLIKSPKRAFLLARMAFWVTASTALIKTFPLDKAMRYITPVRKRESAATLASVAEYAALLDRLLKADFWVFEPICWKRSAVLYRFLLLQGIENKIVFGARKGKENVLEGHAWLEVGGEPIWEKEFPDYNVTFKYP